MDSRETKFLSIEVWGASLVTLAIALAAGFMAYGAMSNEIEHKAKAADVEVINAKINNLTKEVADNTDKLESVAETSKENQIILREIRAQIEDLKDDRPD